MKKKRNFRVVRFEMGRKRLTLAFPKGTDDSVIQEKFLAWIIENTNACWRDTDLILPLDKDLPF